MFEVGQGFLTVVEKANRLVPRKRSLAIHDTVFMAGRMGEGEAHEYRSLRCECGLEAKCHSLPSIWAIRHLFEAIE